MLRVVLDANVLVSAAIQRGPSHRIVMAWSERREFNLVICPTLVDEVEDVLTMRPRLRRWIDIDIAREYVDVLATFDGIVPTPRTHQRQRETPTMTISWRSLGNTLPT